MTEILNICIHSFWFWLIIYLATVGFFYYLMVRFNIFIKENDLVFFDSIDTARGVFAFFWWITVPIELICNLFSFLGGLIKRIATADHPEGKTDSK